MKRRKFIALLGAAAAERPLGRKGATGGESVQDRRSQRGFATPVTPVVVQALRELGYVEGKNLTFERRYAEDRLDRLPKWLRSWLA